MTDNAITSPDHEAMGIALPDGQPTGLPRSPQFPAPGSGDTTGTDGWPDRFAAAIADAMARRTDRKSIRAQFAARRTAGLRKRHADKLARNASSGDPLTPPGFSGSSLKTSPSSRKAQP